MLFSQRYDRNLAYWKYYTLYYLVPALVGYLIWYLAKSGSGRIQKNQNPVHP